MPQPDFGSDPQAAGTIYQPESGDVPVTPSGGRSSAVVSPASSPEMEQFKAYFSTLSTEDQEAFMRKLLADFGGEEGMIDQQHAMAEELRGTEMPTGTQGDRVYTAAHPLQHLSAGLDRYRGVREGQQATVAAGKLTDKRAAAQREMAEALMSMRSTR